MKKIFSPPRKILTIGILSLFMVVALLLTLLPSSVEVSISAGGSVSIEARVALAAQSGGEFGDGTPVSQQIEPTFSRGGPPIVSISYVDGIHIDCSSPYVDIDFTLGQIQQWAKNKTIAQAESIITEEAQAYFEIWVLVSEICDTSPEDPICQDPPVLLDNERIEKRQGKNWLVITIAYFAIHLYNLNFGQGDFVTRINGLGAGPITGDWWQ